MCINRKWIVNRVTKKRVLIDCGKCEACQQAKANKRTLRINLESRFNTPYDWLTLHCTLTYDNEHIPFIRDCDYDRFIDGVIPSLPVYRLNNNYQRLSKKRVVRDGKLVYKVRTIKSFEKIDSFDGYDNRGNVDWLDYTNDSFIKRYLFNYGEPQRAIELPHLRVVVGRMIDGTPKFKKIMPCHDNVKNYVENGRIGVIYYRDIQNWIKNLREYLKNHYGITEKFSFFACSEYGPESNRPHFHVLLHFNKLYLAKFKQAIVETWKFDDISIPSKFERQVKQHNLGASYVSSYVNRSSDFPKFFAVFRPFAPSHCYSHGYGMVSSYCKLPSLLEMAKKGRFLYKRVVNFDGVPTIAEFPIPSYIINRYFPKFKGYSRLNDNEVESIILGCKILSKYEKDLDYTSEDIQKIRVSLNNAYLRWCKIMGYSFDKSRYLFAYDYIRVWNRYYSFLNIYAYEKICNVEEFIYHFDNWYECQNKHDLVIRNLHLCSHLVYDVNKYPQNLAHNDILLEYFHNYKKRKKVRNIMYSINSNV